MTTIINAKTTTAAVINDNYNNDKLELLLERKIASATDGLQPQFIRKIRHLAPATKRI